MSSEHEARRVGLDESQKRCDLLEMGLRTMSEQFEHSLSLLGIKESEIATLEADRESIDVQLVELRTSFQDQRFRLDEEVKRREAEQAAKKEWRRWAGTAIKDTQGLRAKIGAGGAAF
jgi:U3 small nucleolar ribonucleoprotein component